MPRSHRYAIRAELMFLNILRFNMLPANAEGTATLTFNLKHLKIQIILVSQLGSDFPHFPTHAGLAPPPARCEF